MTARMEAQTKRAETAEEEVKVGGRPYFILVVLGSIVTEVNQALAQHALTSLVDKLVHVFVIWKGPERDSRPGGGGREAGSKRGRGEGHYGHTGKGRAHGYRQGAHSHYRDESGEYLCLRPTARDAHQGPLAT